MTQTLAITDTSFERVINGAVLMMGFYIVAPFLDVFAKLASSQILIARITTFRFLVQAFLMLPTFRLTNYKLRFSRSLIQGTCYERYFKEY